MNISDLPLTRIFWSVFTLEVTAVGLLILGALFSWFRQRGPDGGLVGAWIILIPLVILALVAAAFIATSNPKVHFVCVLLLVLPLIAPVITSPVLLVKHHVEERVQQRQHDIGRRGGYLFPEGGQRQLIAAIVDRNSEGIRQALPLAGDLNRTYSQRLPYQLPLGDRESLLSFALDEADESDAFAEALRLLLKAGANPNIPAGKPLSKAILRSRRATEILIDAGADLNADYGNNGAVWWLVLDQGQPENPDVKWIEELLSRGADPTSHNTGDWGPIQKAAANEGWSAVWLLARHVPGAKNIVIGPEKDTVYSRLVREVQGLKDSGQPVPELMRSALEHLNRASR